MHVGQRLLHFLTWEESDTVDIQRAKNALLKIFLKGTICRTLHNDPDPIHADPILEFRTRLVYERSVENIGAISGEVVNADRP